MQLWLQSWWQAFRRDIRESRGLIFGIFALVIGGFIVAVIVAESGDDRSVSSSPVRRASTTVSQPKPTVVRVQRAIGLDPLSECQRLLISPQV